MNSNPTLGFDKLHGSRNKIFSLSKNSQNPQDFKTPQQALFSKLQETQKQTHKTYFQRE